MSNLRETVTNELIAALEDLAVRCDGLEGVQPDGSNMDTRRAHAALAAAKPTDDDHECDTEASVDCDICPRCKEHAGFCSVCGNSDCCGVS